ncbi:MAG: hypothetical protein V1745_03030 [Patescibacteria group bacterium]
MKTSPKAEILVGRIPRGAYNRDPLSLVDGKPLFLTGRDDKEFIVWGEEEGKMYDGIVHLSLADGRPLYLAMLNRKWFVVWGVVEGKKYVSVKCHSIVGGKPLYIAKDDDKQFIVWGEEEYKAYDEVFSLEAKDGVITYGARKGRRIYRVTRTISA